MIKTLEAKKIIRGTNIREEDDNEVIELARSIEANGLLNPLTVVREGGKYRVIAGHRRFRAMQILNEPFIECNVLEYQPSEKEVLCIQLQENCCRKNMSAWELADLFKKLKAKGLDDEAIAKLCGKSKHWVWENLTTAAMLERYDDAEKKTLTVAKARKKYGAIHSVKNGDREYASVCVSKQKHSWSVYINGNIQAETEFLLFIERFKAKWQNLKK